MGSFKIRSGYLLITIALFLFLSAMQADAASCQFSISAQVSPSKITWEAAEKESLITGTIAASADCLKPFILNGNEVSTSRFSLPVAAIGSPFQEWGIYIHPNGKRVSASNRGDEIWRNEIVAEDYCREASAKVSPEQCLEGWDLSRPDGKNRATCGLYSSSKTAVSKPLPSSGLIDFRPPRVSNIAPNSIKIDFDPEYKKQAEIDKKYTPRKPFSILDYLQLSLEVATCDSAPDRLPWTVSLMTTDSEGNEIEISTYYEPTFYGKEDDLGGLTKISQTGNKNYKYQIPIKFPTEESIVESISSGRPVFVRISYKSEKQDVAIPMTNCAQTYGSGQHKVIFGRGKSLHVTIPEIVDLENHIRLLGFGEMYPYKKYIDAFSLYIDIRNHEDKEYLYGIKSTDEPARYMKNVALNSSCRLSKNDYAFTTYDYLLFANARITFDGSEINGIAAPKYRVSIVNNPGISTSMHEFSHTFAGLHDEAGGVKKLTLPLNPAKHEKELSLLGDKNCSLNPLNDFSYMNKNYGQKNIGCHYSNEIEIPIIDEPQTGKTVVSIKKIIPVFDSTKASLMNAFTESNKLNIVSCGYVIAAIKGGKGPEYFSECAGLDVEKPEGFSYAPNKQLASIVNTMHNQNITPSEDERLDGVIFESFGEKGAGVIWFNGEPKPESLIIDIPKPEESPSSSRSEIDKTTGRVYVTSSTFKTAAIPVISKPGISGLKFMVKDLQLKLQMLKNKIDAAKCERGLSPCKNLIPSKPLLPMEEKRQQMGNISEALGEFVEWIEKFTR